MAYNGSGTFLINTSGQPVVSGTIISSTVFNALTADLATGLSTAICKDGQTATTARIPFANGISSTLVTDTTSVSTGSVIVSGGVGIAKALWIGTSANLNGATSGSTAIAASATASGTLTLPAATDTLVGKATTDTLTNKTYDTAGTGNVFKINGTAITAVTGTGSVVLATSPTLVTPALGTPASGTLTNCTGLPISSGVSGLGTGVATFLATPSSANLASALTDKTGTGVNVFGTSPTFTTSVIWNGTSSGTTTVQAAAAASGTLTLPAATDTLVGKATTDTLTNKTFDTAGTGNSFKINGTSITAVTGSGSVVLAASPSISGLTLTGSVTAGGSTGTSGYYLQSTGTGVQWAAGGAFSSLTGGTNTIAAMVVGTGASLTTSGTGTITANQGTFTSSGFTIAGSASGTTTFVATSTASGTLTFPATTDTLVGKATTDTLTNKTFDTAGTGNVFKINGTQISAITGTGSAVLASSPTITTPTITTSATVPLVIGGTIASSTLILESTSGTGTSDAVIFKTGSQSERMRIDTSGNVGIGTTGPSRLFEVVATGTNIPARLGNAQGNLDIGGADGSVVAIDSRTWGLSLQTGGTGRMRIDTSGNVGIATTGPSYTLDVNGTIHYTTLTASSDIRFKTNITPIVNGLDLINKINPIRFEWNEFVNERRNGYALNKPTYGVIAQEIEQVLPDLVSTWKLSDDCQDAKSVNYEKIIPVLIAAIKDLSAKVATLEARLAALEAKG